MEKKNSKLPDKKKKPEWLEGNMYDTQEEYCEACLRDHLNEIEGKEYEEDNIWDIK